MIKEYYKHPRLYLKETLSEGAHISLPEDALHYVRNVMRMKIGDILRIFNGQDGEWVASIEKLDKKAGVLSVGQLLRPQPAEKGRIHLYFAPIKKNRMDILIEKAVELGVDEFHPVLTHRTENRHLNFERLTAQIHEAAEQCERFTIPVLHTPVSLDTVLVRKLPYTVLVALEREVASQITEITFEDELGFIVGPEGGFDDDEIAKITASPIKPVTLGDTVLRAETASIVCLTWAMLSRLER